MSNLQNKTYIAKTFFGLEGVLAEELRQIGAQNVEEINRAVSFEGTQEVMYNANLKLFTALKILQPFFEFEANNEQELYDGIQKINWSEYFSYIDTFKIDTTVISEIFTHSHYVAHKAKDAIADQFKSKFDRRPNIDIENPKFIINLLINDNLVRLSWDCSGESLHKRGYRTATGPAPINEVMAAGLIKLSGWDGTVPLIDPMCGSGTILIEAALMASNTAPGLFRKHFSFMEFEDFDRRLFIRLKNECKRAVKEIDGLITGHDKSWRLLEVAETNIVNAKMDGNIRLSKENFFEHTPKISEGTLIFNPPYGERLNRSEMDMEEFYENIGDKLKQDYAGFDAWIISTNMEAVKRIGLKPSKKIRIFNGAKEGRFLGFELYQGTRKKTKNSEEKVEELPTTIEEKSNNEVLKNDIEIVESKEIETKIPDKKTIAKVVKTIKKEEKKPNSIKKSTKKPPVIEEDENEEEEDEFKDEFKEESYEEDVLGDIDRIDWMDDDLNFDDDSFV